MQVNASESEKAGGHRIDMGLDLGALDLELTTLKYATVELLKPFVIPIVKSVGTAAIGIGALGELGARALSTAKGRVTLAFLGFATVLAACGKKLPEGGMIPTSVGVVPTETSGIEVGTTPEATIYPTAEVFGGGEFGIVKSNEKDPAKLKLEAEYIKSRKQDARKHLDSLLKIDDKKMDFLQFGIVKDGEVVVTDELLNVENPVDPDTKNLFLLSRVNVGNNLVKDIYSPLMMNEATRSVVYIDPATGEQKVWMEEIPGKPGWSNYYPYGGNPIQIQMDLHSSATGGAKNAMVAYVNKDAMLPIKVGANGLEYSIGDKTYRLDIAQGKWVEVIHSKFEEANIDVSAMKNAKLEADGLHITLDTGEVIFTTDQLSRQSYLGQGDIYQIRDEANQNVLFAYDKETNTFLDAAKYIQKDNSDPEKYIQVANWDELKALWAKEKMFLIPFDPDNTYFPELDKIYIDYENWDQSSLNEYSYTNPLGHLPSGMDAPFKFVNYIRMARNTTVIGSTEIYFASQQTYNPDDKSFSVIHPLRVKFSDKTVFDLRESTMDGKFLLPRMTVPSAAVGIPQTRQLELGGLEINGADMSEVRELTYLWLTTGHVPPELEEIPILTISMHY